jgi:AcrR family transcriptional regulator
VSNPTLNLDRRAALKARHREAILSAADALIRERGKPHFSVDELAERADVARRTVFNHFASLDEIVMITCTRVLMNAVAEFRAATAATPVGDGSRFSLFSEITSAVRGMDLPAVVSYLWGVLAQEGDDGRSENVLQDVFTRTTEQLSQELAQRTTELDDLETEILVSSLMNGIAIVSRHWIAQTGGTVDSRSRILWNDLMDRLVATVRTGYTLPS